ncbi:cytochrome c biogenesis protein DipZ [Streptomyces sp. NPDC057428]|uniref:cytochrome c biogenesis protein DipZ n=1 Tax=Streptomyces sp. NPDC057428 TaxID=3346129 RepID=UPI003674358B
MTKTRRSRPEVVLITLVLIGLIGGFITAISPCILPVLPLVFLSGGVQGGKPEQATTRSRRPYAVIAGLVVSFTLITLFGTLVLSALPLPQDIIRWAGLVVLLVLGVAMMFPRVQDLLERPFARIGQRQVGGTRGGFFLGLALGAVYVPCAGPVLAAITVAGATHQIGLDTVALALAFALGTAVPLTFFALAGQRIGERVRAFRGRQRRVQFFAGLTFVALAIGLTFNVTDALQRAVPDYTASVNKAISGSAVTGALGSEGSGKLRQCVQQPSSGLHDCGKAPEFAGIQSWLNTPKGAPLTISSLKGKVVLVDFWAYSCINCHRAGEHINAWYDKYKGHGLEIVGVHTPEYAFEHDLGNVKAGAERLGIKYPVALDNDFRTWQNFSNVAWPAQYLIDADGRVRNVAVGEGGYADREKLIRQLLMKANPGATLPAPTGLPDHTPTDPTQTPEIGLGVGRSDAVANGPLDGGHGDFTYSDTLGLGQYALTGGWDVGKESVTSGHSAGITLKYSAREVYLDVGGTGTITATVDGRKTTQKVSGAPNIYRLAGGHDSRNRVLNLTLSPGLKAYSFTFG